MPLLGQAAMLLSFDIAEEAIAEHDDWHTQEHMPERLSIPGFVRGTRWVATQGKPRYFVVYEVRDLAVLSSAPYLERLNQPTPWTSKMMPFYRGMRRGFCALSGSFGFGTGHAGLVLRFSPAAGAEESLRAWLLRDALPRLPSLPGIGSAHLFEAAAKPQMTNEQRIRGTDGGVDWALLVTGYRLEVLADLGQGALGGAQLERQGAADVAAATCRMDFTLTDRDVRAVP
jgi:hypothetical protein